MAEVRIPQTARDVVLELGSMDADTFAELRSAIIDAADRLSMRVYTRRLAVLGDKAPSSERLLEVLSGTYITGSGLGWGPEAIGLEYKNAAVEAGLIEEGRLASTFGSRLGELLATPGIDGFLQALGLIGDHEKLFHEAVIVTDLRPIMLGEEDAPRGVVISSSLRMDYHEDGIRKSIYVAMDKADLASFRRAIQDAEEDSERLAAFAGGQGIKCFEVEASDDE